MGFNKTKYDEFASYKPGGGNKSDWFKPRFPDSGEERYHVRILPAVGDEKFPLIDRDLHYWNSWPAKAPEGVESGVSCSVNGEFDLATDIYWKLRTFFDPKSPQNSAIQALKPVTRVYANAIVLQTPNGKIPVEEQKPQPWSMTYRAGSDLKSLMDDYIEFAKDNPDDYAPIDDVERGRDLVVKMVGGPPKKTVFSAYPKERALKNVEDLAEQTTPLSFSADQRVLTAEQCREFVRPVLGDFYDEIITAYVEAGGKASEATILEDENDLGEEV